MFNSLIAEIYGHIISYYAMILYFPCNKLCKFWEELTTRIANQIWNEENVTYPKVVSSILWPPVASVYPPVRFNGFVEIPYQCSNTMQDIRQIFVRYLAMLLRI
jgi:hypothetical protein